LRRSTDEDHQPFSLDAQEAKLRAFVESQPGKRTIVAVYSDDASGATTDREDLQRMLKAARARLFDTVLVYRVDRFFRRLSDLVGLLDDLSDIDVVFRSATEPFDTSTPVGRLLVQMRASAVQAGVDVVHPPMADDRLGDLIRGMAAAAAKGWPPRPARSS
jgi:site-specific DNA recombinase